MKQKSSGDTGEGPLQPRRQRTIARPAEFHGFGFLTGADVTLRFLPAAENTGLRFQRVDLPGTEPIPATLDYVVPRQRRTAISNGTATVELIEHVMAAMAGLQIDNCLVQVNATECPGADGSSLGFVQALLDAGIIEQSAFRDVLVVHEACLARGDDDRSEISAGHIFRRTLVISYELDYGPRSPIKPQLLTFEFSPEAFVTSLAFARTFVLETEIAALKSQGYGSRVTPADLLVFGPTGVIGNELRAPDECVRHKILDCIGDFALLGCDIHGHFRAYRSGHNVNHAICRSVADAHNPLHRLRQPA
ncbi:MAG: UDP-3-0-acyl N-acetylglucosamine deacetylase [Schlesneria sp.]|nr:UDP-3-0-acyl N-acetylglucosamine deacetylase [Schlesneria sp.]